MSEGVRIRLFRGDEDKAGVFMRLSRLPSVGESVAYIDGSGSEQRYRVTDVVFRDIDRADAVAADVDSMLVEKHLNYFEAREAEEAAAQRNQLQLCQKHNARFGGRFGPCVHCLKEAGGA